MKYSKLIFTLLLSILYLAKGYSQSTEIIYEEAIQEAEKGNYDDAIILLEGILKDGLESATLYNNLGYCYFANQKFGLAILNFEKALLLEPLHKDVIQNLNLIRLQIEIPQEPSASLIKIILLKTVFNFTLPQLLFVSVVILLISLLLRYIKLHISYKLLHLTEITLYIASSTIFFIGLLHVLIINRSIEAIIIVGPVNLRSAASHQAKHTHALQEGEKVLIIENFKNWYKVKSQNESSGWVEKKKLGIIKTL